VRSKVGIVGCGNISEIYLKNLHSFADVEVASVADMDPERARARAQQFQIPRALPVEALLAEADIEIVLNLTIPQAHHEIAMAALAAGKSVYNEKPLAVTREDARKVLDLASERGLRVGCAPDTFLGAALQTSRQLIDTGAIGTPVGATAFMISHGHEHWHPDPAFYYQPGGGPMFDMGPYYLTALVSLIGPIRRVTGSAQSSFSERIVTSAPKFGSTIQVQVPTNIATVVDFANGAVGTMLMTFDVWQAGLPRMEIYGSEGTLRLPDPNFFGGAVELWHREARAWRSMPLINNLTANLRGLGVVDMARALREGRGHRANGELAYHVLEIMHAAHDASREERHIKLASTCERPAPGPTDEFEFARIASNDGSEQEM
jgi:predicted dehydrogenase